MQLTSMGMSLVDKKIQGRIKNWDHKPRNITNINIQLNIVYPSIIVAVAKRLRYTKGSILLNFIS